MDMPDFKHQKRSSTSKIANLERVRNNQRRSRAKRKAYVADLEEKIRKHEVPDTQSATDHTVQHLIRENDTLRRLLLSLGLGDDFLVAYINASGTAVKALKTATQPDNQIRLDVTNCCETERFPSPAVKQDSLTTGVSVEKKVLSPLETYSSFGVVDSALQPYRGNQLTSPHLAESVPWEFSTDNPSYFGDIEATWPAYGPIKMTSIAAQSEDDMMTVNGSKIPWEQEDTTLCSVAFSLIMTSNRKGYSAADLDLKLRIGYRHEHATLKGCRIDNRTLLRVLTEII